MNGPAHFNIGEAANRDGKRRFSQGKELRIIQKVKRILRRIQRIFAGIEETTIRTKCQSTIIGYIIANSEISPSAIISKSRDLISKIQIFSNINAADRLIITGGDAGQG